INAGDCMFALAHSALYRLQERQVDPAVVVRAAKRFDETCLALTRGQYLDMDFEVRQEVIVDEDNEMIGGKTAALLALCGELDARVAGVDDGTIARSAAFGRDLGLASQVRDDLLGSWADADAIGTWAATDIEARNKTLPVRCGLTRNPELRTLCTPADNG